MWINKLMNDVFVYTIINPVTKACRLSPHTDKKPSLSKHGNCNTMYRIYITYEPLGLLALNLKLDLTSMSCEITSLFKEIARNKAFYVIKVVIIYLCIEQYWALLAGQS